MTTSIIMTLAVDFAAASVLASVVVAHFAFREVTAVSSFLFLLGRFLMVEV